MGKKEVIKPQYLLPIIVEFFRALKQGYTYSPHRNSYCIFGILWGIPVPLVTVGIDMYAAGLNLTIENIIFTITQHPIHIFFSLHPLFFGIVFGAMGTIRFNKDKKIKEFEQNLIDKNKELLSANKQLKELDKLKANFLSMISHELRTPLTTIQGYISFLQTEKAGPLNTTQKELLHISQEETQHLNNLIEELLDIAKIHRKEFKLKMEAVYINKIVEKAIVSVESYAKTKNISIENKLSPNIPKVYADKEKILQVIVNLLNNGIKFNKEEGKVTISCFSSHNSKEITFCIADTGIGIPQTELDNIFEKFYQIDVFSQRRYSGMGLGLAISKRIIELHNGKIWVKSSLGNGSHFFFTLKRAHSPKN